MGGLGSVRLPAAAPGRWGYAVALSGWYPEEVLAELKAAGALPVQWVLRCGTEDPLLPSNHALLKLLREQGAQPDYREQAGGHSFNYWSRLGEEMLLCVDGYFRSVRNQGAAPAPAALIGGGCALSAAAA